MDVAHMVTYPTTQPFYDNAPKPSWYNEHDYCKMHHVKGNKIEKFLRIRHCIKDFIDNGEIEVNNPKKTQKPNKKMGIYKEPFPKHDKLEKSKSDQGESSQSYKEVN